jgi:hypothetical protein
MEVLLEQQLSGTCGSAHGQTAESWSMISHDCHNRVTNARWGVKKRRIALLCSRGSASHFERDGEMGQVTAIAHYERPSASPQARQDRILMPTCRNFTKRAVRCGLYEAQDVLVDLRAVDLDCIERGWWVNQRWLRLLPYREISRKTIFVIPGLQRLRLTGDCDLFFAVCQGYLDLPYINAIQGWRSVGVRRLDNRTLTEKRL